MRCPGFGWLREKELGGVGGSARNLARLQNRARDREKERERPVMAKPVTGRTTVSRN